MRLSEILTEDSRSYLYTNVNRDKLDTVLRTNILPATWTHILPSGERKAGTSLSRNPRLGRRMWSTPFGPVQLVLNQDKLRNNYRLVPLDAEYAVQKQIEPERLNDPRWRKRYNDRMMRAGEQPFAEEFVIGDVKPLSRYLEKIVWVQEYEPGYNRKYDDDLRMLRRYAKEHGIKFVDVNKRNQKQFEPRKGQAEPIKRDRSKDVNL